MASKSLFTTLFSEDCQGVVELRAFKGSIRRQEFFPIEAGKQMHAFILNHKGFDIYFAVATRDGGGKKEHIVSIPAVWQDIDFKAVDKAVADERLKNFAFEPTAVVNSGNGYHVYWKLKEPLGIDDVERVERVMRGLCVMLGGDTASTDASRILRVPTTHNYKYRPARPVRLMYCNDNEYSLFDFEDIIPTAAHNPQNVVSINVKSAKIDAIMQCAFMQHCRDNASSLPEEHWYAMITQLAKETGGISMIHQLSKGYPKYSKAETDAKILHASDTTGPRSCKKIKDIWPCELDCGVVSPAALAHRVKEDLVSTVSGVSTVSEESEVSSVSDGKQTVSRNGILVSSGKQTVSSVSRNEDEKEALILGGITAQLREYIKDSSGTFSVNDVDREFNLNSRPEKNARSRALNILIKEKRIIRDRTVKGRYHILDDSLNIIDDDPSSACAGHFPIKLPLGLDGLVGIPPKSIIVVAGATNAGKTAILLNMARDNLHGGKPILYLMSEMGRAEFLSRRNRFNLPREAWANMKAAERSVGFNSAIWHHNREGITLVDFLEDVGGEFFKIPAAIREIYDSLGDGIAVIAIQKRAGQAYARGGEGTAEKSRLYIAVDHLLECEGFSVCSAKIIKAKDCLENKNINGKELHFKLFRGTEIVPITKWQWVSEEDREKLKNQYARAFKAKQQRQVEWFNDKQEECPF